MQRQWRKSPSPTVQLLPCLIKWNLMCSFKRKKSTSKINEPFHQILLMKTTNMTPNKTNWKGSSRLPGNMPPALGLQPLSTAKCSHLTQPCTWNCGETKAMGAISESSLISQLVSATVRCQKSKKQSGLLQEDFHKSHLPLTKHVAQEIQKDYLLCGYSVITNILKN